MNILPIIRSLMVIIVLTAITGSVCAQKDLRPGYIITLENDTVKGEIDYRGDILMGDVCRFIYTGQKEIIEFKPGEIIGYRFSDGKYFISREIFEKVVFLEFLIKGEINIYYYRDEVRDYYFMEKEGYKLVEIPYEEKIIYKDNKAYSYKTAAHRYWLNEYMKDAPDFDTRISRMVKPEHRSLIKLAEDYHNEVCKDEVCIIYEKKQPFIKVNVELVSGFSLGNRPLSTGKTNYSLNGFLLHLWLPRSNEKLFLRMGMLFFPKEIETDIVGIFRKFPIHLTYMMPATFRVRPTFSIGPLSPSYAAGLNLRVTKKINLGVQGGANFYGFMVFPTRFESYSVMASIYFDLR